jgi:N-methylhydantoinase A
MEINVDIGGTFTDCFAIDGSRTLAAKALTTHHELAVGFLRGLEEIAEMLGESLEDALARTQTIRYATTLGTNALIERTGPRLGLITTAGHESVVRSVAAASGATGCRSPSTAATSPPSGPIR